MENIEEIQKQVLIYIHEIEAGEIDSLAYAQSSGFEPDNDSTLAKKEAELLISQPELKDRICAALESLSDDTENLSKSISLQVIPTLLSALKTHQGVLHNSLVIAWASIIIARALIKGFCAK
jgi:hypothetical protein